MSEVSKLYNRAGVWETKSQQASAAGDFNKAGRCRTKSLQIMELAKELERKALRQSTEPHSNVVAEAEEGKK